MPKVLLLSLVTCCLLLTVFSYGFVDANFPFKTSIFLYNLIHRQCPLATVIYVVLVLGLFGIYGYALRQVKRKKLKDQQIWRLIFLTVGILFFSFPAFSYDIFNYIMTAKVVTFYHENPYIVMPIEFLGEPMLAFMHLANKTTPYPPFWIILTLVPSLLAKENILVSIFLFKSLVVVFYLGLVFLIWKILGQISPKRKLKGLVFFAFNPLVLIETLISSHNDVVMMFFALLGFYLFLQKRKVLSFLSLLASVSVKYVTIVLFPIFVFFSRLKKEKLVLLSCWVLFFVFFLSPLKRETYPWYFIWVLSFAALVDNKFLFWLTLAFSFGVLCRYLPFLYTMSWGGITPLVKRWVTIIPPAMVILIFLLKQAFFKLNESRH